MIHNQTLIKALLPHVNAQCAEILKDGDARALAAWRAGINEHGHLEIAGRYSATGGPVSVFFTARNAAEIEAAKLELVKLMAEGREEEADELLDNFPEPLWQL